MKIKVSGISSLIFILFLVGCSSASALTSIPAQPEPASTFMPLSTNTPKPTGTFTPSPTIVPEITVAELTKISNDKQTVLKGFQGTALSLAWSKDGKTLFIGTGQSGLIIYNVEKNKVIANPNNGSRIQALALSSDEKVLAVGIANDHSIRFIDPQTGDLLNSLSTPNWPPVSTFSVLAFSPDGKVLASGGDDGQIFLWDTATGKEIKHFFETTDFSIGGISFSPDGKSLIASFGGEIRFKVWDTTTWELQKIFFDDFANEIAFRTYPKNN